MSSTASSSPHTPAGTRRPALAAIPATPRKPRISPLLAMERRDEAITQAELEEMHTASRITAASLVQDDQNIDTSARGAYQRLPELGYPRPLPDPAAFSRGMRRSDNRNRAW